MSRINWACNLDFVGSISNKDHDLWNVIFIILLIVTITSSQQVKEVLSPETKIPTSEVLFLETDGFFTSRQKPKGATQSRPGRKACMVRVHSGWKNTFHSGPSRLVDARVYDHTGNTSFWEGVQEFLEQTYELDYGRTDFLINGDGTVWIDRSEQASGSGIRNESKKQQ